MRWFIAALAGCGAILCAGVAARGLDKDETGAVVGTVRFTGEVPAPKLIIVSDGSKLEHNDLVVDRKTKGLRYVVVMLEDAPRQPKINDAEPVLVDQVHWVFRPRVVAVQHGQAVRFDNSDSVNHSVTANSTERANQFNLVAGPGTPIVKTLAPQKAPVMIGCSLHPWMRAWVYVLEHPWFAVTDEQGGFRIANLPPGKHRLVLVHPDSGGRQRQTIDIRPGEESQLEIEWTEWKEEGGRRKEE